MKKEVILEALKNAGVELDEEKQKEFITAINVANDADIQKYKSQYSTLEEQKKEVENQLQLKNEELAKFNQDEINELKKYKEDNELKIKQGNQNEIIKKFLTENKFSSDDILLNFVNNALQPQFDENSNLTNGDALLSGLNEKASQYKITETAEGAKAMIQPLATPQEEDPFIAGFNKNEK